MVVERRCEPRAASLPSCRLAVPADRLATRQRLQAADVPAPAHDRGVVDDLDVPDVAGTPLRAAVKPTVGDDPRADARPDLHHDHVVVALCDPRAPLPEGQDVDVVVDPDRGAVARRESFADRVAVPAGHDRRRDGPPGRELHGTRHADADPPGSAGHAARGPLELPEQLLDPPEDPLRAVADARRLGVAAQDPAGQVRDGDADARRAEVRHEHVPRVRSEPELARWSAARARTHVAFDHEPPVDQLLDPAGDDRAPEPRPRPELRTRPRAAQPDLVQDHDEGVQHFVGNGRQSVGQRWIHAGMLLRHGRSNHFCS
jgi:hypothetical protein